MFGNPGIQLYLIGAAVIIAIAIVYMLDPSFGGMLRTVKVLPPRGVEGFSNMQNHASNEPSGDLSEDGDAANRYSSVAAFDDQLNPTGDSGNQLPNGCAPRKQLNPQELLPKDNNTLWGQMNPQGQGDLAGKNYVQAGHFIGIQTQGSSNKNPNLQLRADPVIPQVQVSPWSQSTIQPDMARRGVELN